MADAADVKGKKGVLAKIVNRLTGGGQPAPNPASAPKAYREDRFDGPGSDEARLQRAAKFVGGQ